MYICTKYWLTSKQIWLIKDEPLWISSLLLITFYRCTMTLSHSPSQWEHFTISIYITSDIYGWWHYSLSHILSPKEGCTELPKPSIAKVCDVGYLNFLLGTSYVTGSTRWIITLLWHFCIDLESHKKRRKKKWR